MTNTSRGKFGGARLAIALCAASLALAACAPQASPTPPPTQPSTGTRATMDALMTDTAPPSPTPVDETAVRDWLNQNNFPITSYDFNAPTEDLRFLDQLVADKQVVLLGDATYGTHEFLSTKARIARYLIENHGYRNIILEASWGQTQVINDQLLSGNGNLYQALLDHGGFWLANQEFLGLLEWIRSFNRTHPGEKVMLQGYDLQDADILINNILEFVDTVLPEQGEKYYDTLLCAWSDNLLDKPVDLLEACHMDIQAISLQFAQEGQELALATHRARARELEKELELISSHVEVFIQGTISDDEAGSFLLQQNAENAIWLVDHNSPAGNSIIWAHNQEAAYTGLGIGVFLRDYFGPERLVNIGFAYSNGRFLAADGYGLAPGLSEYEYSGSLDRFYEAFLALADAPGYFLELGNASPDQAGAAWLFEEHLMQYANWYAHWDYLDRPSVMIGILDNYDGLIYIEDTTPAWEFSEWMNGPNAFATPDKFRESVAKPLLKLPA